MIFSVAALVLVAGCGAVDESESEPGDGGSPATTGAGGSEDVPRSPLDAAWEASAPTSAAPTGRWGHVAAAIDEDRAVLLGGTGSGVEDTVHDDAWLYDVSSGAPTLSLMNTGAGAAPRYCGCAVYDPQRDTVVAIGGRDLAGPLAAETWELDLAQSAWTQTAASPPGVVGCAAAYSKENGMIYLFGGGSATGFDDGTYRYDASAGTWQELDVGGPSPRYDAVMREAPDGSLVLFSGSYMGSFSNFYSDVWRFDVATETWTEISMSEVEPVGRRVPWVAAAPDGGFYLAFGLQGSQPLADAWHADLDAGTWTLMTGDAAPGPRAFTPVLPGGNGAAGYLLGGFDGAAPLSDMWRLRYLD